MTATRPRGPLPRRVYWFRRLLVLGVALALVFGVGRLLEGQPWTDSQPSARPASAGTRAMDLSTTAPATPEAEPRPAKRRNTQPRSTRTPLAMPKGPCLDSDVQVVPAMDGSPYAGDAVSLRLRLTTVESPACTWEVGPDTVAVKVTSGSDRIWSSQECPAAVPTTQVVLRDTKPTYVDVRWSGRRSDPDCSRTTSWALPGYYHVSAAALGAEPQSEQFRLVEPAPATITPSPKPRKAKKDEAAARG